MEAAKLNVVVDTVEYSPEERGRAYTDADAHGIAGNEIPDERVAEQDFSLPPCRSAELRDMTVGVVGTGKIGRTVIARIVWLSCACI